MKRVLASMAVLGLMASPALAASATKTTTKAAATTQAKTTAKATTSVAKQAKAEGESVKTEAKEIKHHAAAKYGTYRRCAPSHMASNHHTATMHKAAAKKG